jgi:hypothetical protein
MSNTGEAKLTKLLKLIIYLTLILVGISKNSLTWSSRILRELTKSPAEYDDMTKLNTHFSSPFFIKLEEL